MKYIKLIAAVLVALALTACDYTAEETAEVTTMSDVATALSFPENEIL